MTQALIINSKRSKTVVGEPANLTMNLQAQIANDNKQTYVKPTLKCNLQHFVSAHHPECSEHWQPKRIKRYRWKQLKLDAKNATHEEWKKKR